MDTSAVLERDSQQDIDVIDEIRMRTWARQNYKPADDREDGLHPVVLDEMLRKDCESR